MHFFAAFQQAKAETTTYIDAARSSKGPQTYKDINSGSIFYVESDGRHVTAINPEGKILWHKDPFIDAHLESYRTKNPLIVFIGKPNDWMTKDLKGTFIGIGFNSSQFGIMDLANGEFFFMGQD